MLCCVVLCWVCVRACMCSRLYERITYTCMYICKHVRMMVGEKAIIEIGHERNTVPTIGELIMNSNIMRHKNIKEHEITPSFPLPSLLFSYVLFFSPKSYFLSSPWLPYLYWRGTVLRTDIKQITPYVIHDCNKSK